MTTDADRVKPLEWEGSEARTPQGDLYTVRQLSRIVWVTSLNGTDCPGWSPTEALAKARAQAHYDNSAALAPAPQAADAKPLIEFAREMLSCSWQGGDADGGYIQETASRLGLIHAVPYDATRHGGTEASEGDTVYELRPDLVALAAAPLLPEGWVLVPKEPTDAMTDAGEDCLIGSDAPSLASSDIYRAMLAAAQEGNGNV